MQNERNSVAPMEVGALVRIVRALYQADVLQNMLVFVND